MLTVLKAIEYVLGGLMQRTGKDRERIKAPDIIRTISGAVAKQSGSSLVFFYLSSFHCTLFHAGLATVTVFLVNWLGDVINELKHTVGAAVNTSSAPGALVDINYWSRHKKLLLKIAFILH